MGKKGFKSAKGQGEEWQEPKSERLSLKLTPKCKQLLQQKADSMNTSVAEVIEHTVRGMTTFPSQDNDRLPTLEQIKQVLPRLAGSAIAELVLYAVELMRGYFYQSETSAGGKSIAKLITENWDKCVEGLVGAIALERLQALGSGTPATLEELEPLSTVLPCSLDELETIWRKELKNGNSRAGCTNSH
jgi:hypothetical protein